MKYPTVPMRRLDSKKPSIPAAIIGIEAAATSPGPMASAASAHLREALSETSVAEAQKTSKYKSVSPAPNHASPRFGDHAMEANVHAAYPMRRLVAATLHHDRAPPGTPRRAAASMRSASAKAATAHVST